MIKNQFSLRVEIHKIENISERNAICRVSKHLHTI